VPGGIAEGIGLLFNEIMKNYSDIPSGIRLILKILYYTVPLGLLAYFLDDTYGLF
tara:strand:- start:606 stop:770 length:165 start_codon:yes stop_codon:yes gene_type:complete